MSSTLRYDEIAERLKDVAHELTAVGLKATFQITPDTWTHIEVHHAWLFADDSPDGWETEITHTAL